nr:MAG TPA: head closure knob [Caudoviricetes sp.]
MRDISCKLLSTTSKTDDIGVQKNATETTETEIPILKVEDIYANEYYRANEQGYKPSLRLRISTLNYDNQKELIYMNNKYSIIRTQEVTVDELILICERKIKNVQKH